MRARERISSVVPEDAAGLRVDRYVCETLALFPRSQIAHRDVQVAVDGRSAKLSRRVRAGETVTVDFAEPEASRIEPEEIAFEIIFENADVVVINKPAGMVVHPAAGNWTGTLAQGLMHHVTSLADSFGGDVRPGIVHRLDKDTSGVIIAAKHPDALSLLASQFKSHETRKRYLAIVKGRLPRSRGTLETRVARDPRNRKRFAVTASGGKEAITEYRVLKHYPHHSFVLLLPRTGRTHQLRVHMAHIGCPILGDPLYSRPDRSIPEAGLALHAYQLTIRLPGESASRTFTAPLPEDFKQGLEAASGLRSER